MSKQFWKKIINWNALLTLIIVLTITIGAVMIHKSSVSSDHILLGFGTGFISSGVVAFLIEISHLLPSFTKTQKLKELFYKDVKYFLNELLYYASFYFNEGEDRSAIDMLNYLSDEYKQKATTFHSSGLTEDNYKLLDSINYLIKQRRNFKLFLAKIDNEKFTCVIHDIIDMETEQTLSSIIFDYNWIVGCFDDNKLLGVIPEAYSKLLQSVAQLIEKDVNLKVFKVITFYSTSDNGTPGYVNENDYKQLSKIDRHLLSAYKVMKNEA